MDLIPISNLFAIPEDQSDISSLNVSFGQFLASFNSGGNRNC